MKCSKTTIMAIGIGSIAIAAVVISFRLWITSSLYVTPLVRSAMAGDVEAAAKEIRNGSELNRQVWIIGSDKHAGWTALMWAAYLRHENILRMLIDAGADVNVQDGTGRTALHIAFYGDNRISASNIVKLLLNNGADPNLLDSNGTSPLINAARSDDADSCYALVDNGANVDASDHSGATAMQIAAFEHPNILVVRKLLERGVNVRSRLPNGRSLIEVAQGRDVDPQIAAAIAEAARK